jgi:hypothetical protein
MKRGIVPIAASHGDRPVRHAIIRALADSTASDAADRLIALAAGNRDALMHAAERARSLSRIPKAGRTRSPYSRAVEALDLALERSR